MKLSAMPLSINQRSHQQSIKSKCLLLSSIAVISVFSSCASDPVPEVIHPITIPTPPISNENIAPDPVNVSDAGDTTAPVHFSTPGVMLIAKRVPGRPGFVFNPYNQNMVNVEGIPSGTKVKDPQDNNDTHVFKVP